MGQTRIPLSRSATSARTSNKGRDLRSWPDGNAFLFCPNCRQTLCQELADGVCPYGKKKIGKLHRQRAPVAGDRPQGQM